MAAQPLRVLVPTDGSPIAIHALEQFIVLAQRMQPIEVDLLYVQSPVSGDTLEIIGRDEVVSVMQEEREAALGPARALLERHAIRYRETALEGAIAPAIADYARAHRSDLIVMGTRGLGPLRSVVLGSVATQVLRLVEVPVMFFK